MQLDTKKTEANATISLLHPSVNIEALKVRISKTIVMKVVRSLISGFSRYFLVVFNSKVVVFLLLAALFLLTMVVKDIMGKTFIQ